MSAFAPLTLLNNAGTNVVFNPQSIDSEGVATYLSGDAILDAKKKVTISVNLPKGGSTVARVKEKIVVPIMDTIDFNKKVAEAYVTVDFVLPKLASQTIRMDLRKYIHALIDDAITKAAIQDLESIY